MSLTFDSMSRHAAKNPVVFNLGCTDAAVSAGRVDGLASRDGRRVPIRMQSEHQPTDATTPNETRTRVKYVRRLDQVTQLTPEQRDRLGPVEARYVFRANDYYLGLIDWDDPEDPIRQLIIPRLAGISDLLAPNGPFIHPRAAERTKFCSSPNRPAPEAVTAARSDVEATGAAAFRAFLRHRSTRVPLLRHAGFVALSPRVSLPARVVPRSSAACRRTAAWSDALLPGGASSTGRASRAGPRSSPAAAGDS